MVGLGFDLGLVWSCGLVALGLAWLACVWVWRGWPASGPIFRVGVWVLVLGWVGWLMLGFGAVGLLPQILRKFEITVYF